MNPRSTFDLAADGSVLEYATCACTRCSGRIEFPVHGIGMEINCPRCGQRTTLNNPALKLIAAGCDAEISSSGLRAIPRHSPKRLLLTAALICGLLVILSIPFVVHGIAARQQAARQRHTDRQILLAACLQTQTKLELGMTWPQLRTTIIDLKTLGKLLDFQMARNEQIDFGDVARDLTYAQQFRDEELRGKPFVENLWATEVADMLDLNLIRGRKVSKFLLDYSSCEQALLTRANTNLTSVIWDLRNME